MPLCTMTFQSGEQHYAYQCITVVMTLFLSSTGLVNEKLTFSDPQGTKTPESIDIKLDTSDYVGDITCMQNLRAGLRMHKFVDPLSIF